MNSIAAISFILHDHYGVERLGRFFHSLAAQRIPAYRLEVCLVDTHTRPETARLARRHQQGADGFRLSIIPAQGADPATAWNLGLENCTGLLAACVRPGLRLDPDFAMAHLLALRDHPESDVLCADFVHGGSRGRGMVRAQGALQERLRQLDALGPLPVLTRRARRRLRFRAASTFPSWELGIQAAQFGLRFHRLRRPLYSIPFEEWDAECPVEELARLVTRQAAFFHVDQLRWALAVLRRKSWSDLSLEAPRLPSPQDIRAMQERRVRELRLSRHGQIPGEVLPGPVRPLGMAGVVGA